MNDYSELSVTVAPGDVDMNGRMRPSALLRLVQNSLEEHCRLLGIGSSFLDTLDAMWVVAHVQTDVFRLPRCGERAVLRVWTPQPALVLFPRCAVMRTESGEELWRYSALWVPVSRKTRTLMKPELLRFFPQFSCSIAPLPQPPGNLPFPVPEHSESRAVRCSELDSNGHLNHCRYADWAEDLLPADFHCRHALRSLWADYRSEILPETEPLLEYTLQDDALYVRGVSEKKVLFKMRASYDTI